MISPTLPLVNCAKSLEAADTPYGKKVQAANCMAWNYPWLPTFPVKRPLAVFSVLVKPHKAFNVKE